MDNKQIVESLKELINDSGLILKIILSGPRTCNSQKEKGGPQVIRDGTRVYLYIDSQDSAETICDNIELAGDLVGEAKDLISHNEKSPDLFTAIEQVVINSKPWNATLN